MFCPQCSQPQLSDEMRFCSRCGFPLSDVRELVASGGQLAPPQTPPPPALKGLRRGTWLLLIAMALVVPVGVLTGIEEDFAFLFLLPFLIFIVGLARLFYANFVEARRTRPKTDAQLDMAASPQMSTAARPPAMSLPAAESKPVLPTRKWRTAEMVEPPSVTESTTRLLEDEASSDRK